MCGCSRVRQNKHTKRFLTATPEIFFALAEIDVVYGAKIIIFRSFFPLSSSHKHKYLFCSFPTAHTELTHIPAWRNRNRKRILLNFYKEWAHE